MFFSADISICRDAGCKTVADMIKGKSPEEIRKLFDVVNDFTPEEEVRLHNRHHYSANRLIRSDPRSTGPNQEGERVGRRSMSDSKPNGFFILVIEFLFSFALFCSRPLRSNIKLLHPRAFLKAFLQLHLNPFYQAPTLSLHGATKLFHLILRSLPLEPLGPKFLAVHGLVSVMLSSLLRF